MRFLSPTESRRLNEAIGFVFLVAGLATWLSLVSYHAEDPSWNTAGGVVRPSNLIGLAGAYLSDILYQSLGLGAYALPVIFSLLGWKWMRSEALESPWVKLVGWVLLLLSICAALSLGPRWSMFDGTVSPGGLAGFLAADTLTRGMNLVGAVLLTLATLVVSIYLVSSFTMSKLASWFEGPLGWARSAVRKWNRWKEERRHRRMEKRALEARREAEAERQKLVRTRPKTAPLPLPEPEEELPASDIPICPLVEPQTPPIEARASGAPWEEQAPAASERRTGVKPVTDHPAPVYQLPSTALLNEPQGRNPYDEQELKETAARIKSKCEEFNVLGQVVQINPGPVVTTFEFKPEAGIKVSRVTTLGEDLCLGLQAESILIERIPGKSTVGIEVPNTKREVISLRQVLESDEFQHSASRLTLPLGKDINGRIRVVALDAMPHLLIAGSTGSGKSVMLNCMIMSILYKATPDEVRMVLVDPKRLELGLYEGIPHLLTPVITDPRKATNALRNAVLEMERRLRLLAAQGVRSIDQYNKKIRRLREEPMSLFEEDDADDDELQPLPYILILIDELADLMMVEGRNVEESVTRLAQMARAVGMHLVVATQRPSVDVITGLIKANFPARISFRVATRVDSRTILDCMGSEHLLGKGDMLFLPPGSGRLTRVHGAFVTETEINKVVDFWKEQAAPEYDQSFLVAPPADEDEELAGAEDAVNEQDPLYEDALRVVLEMGKASTSTLQRRLRLGYGRAARILDMMYRDGIIGPPDGSKPREVLKRPDWLREVTETVRN